MSLLDGRVAIVTGGGRGVGREHALLLAQLGASVVVNDLGGGPGGGGEDGSAARQVADEITAVGGTATANTDSVSDWAGAQRLVEQAVSTYGDLHILVNNAGVLRDQMLVNMTENDWDTVVDVHLKGHFCVTRHAAVHWRTQSKAGADIKASIIHTSSTSGLFPQAGQANYSAVKAGIVAFSGVCARELSRYGVRSNTIAPAARTRLTESAPGVGELVRAPEEGGFDWYDPANVSPMVAYLASAECPFNGEVFFVGGDTVSRFLPYSVADTVLGEGRRFSVEDLIARTAELTATAPPDEKQQRARLRPRPTAVSAGDAQGNRS
jgi:NAD(P)-dependent dehydrogenase (short-subunit alcohol dehydrogenase family)